MELEQVLERLAHLEGEHRRLIELHQKRRWRTGAAWVVILSLGLAGAMRAPGVPKVIEAERFILRDPAGVARMELAVLPGETGFVINDSQGKKRLTMSVNRRDDLPGLSLHNANGEITALFALTKDRGTALLLTDNKHEQMIELKTQDDKGATVQIRDEGREPKIALASLKSGISFLSLMNAERTGSAKMIIEPDGMEKLTLADPRTKTSPKSNTSFHLQCGPDGTAGLNFIDNEKIPRIALGLKDLSPPMLTLCDPIGHPRVELGLGPIERAGLVVTGSKKASRLTAVIDSDNTPHFGLFDEDDKTLFEVPQAKP